MAVASVSKITAASPTSFDAAIQEGLVRASKTLRGITGLHVHRGEGEREQRKDRGISGDHGTDLHFGRMSLIEVVSPVARVMCGRTAKSASFPDGEPSQRVT